MNKWLRKSLSLLALALVFVGVMTIASAADIEVATSEEFVDAVAFANAAEEPTTITVADDFTLTGNAVYDNAKGIVTTVVSDGDHTITFDTAGRIMVKHTTGGKLVFTADGGVLTLTTSEGYVPSAKLGACLNLAGSSTVEFENIEVCNFTAVADDFSDRGGFAYINAGSKLSLTNCNIHDNKASSGGAIGFGSSESTKLTINGGIFKDNIATQAPEEGKTNRGGGVFYHGGSATSPTIIAKGVRFEGNKALNGAGGVLLALYSKGCLTSEFEKCKFVGNTAALRGNVLINTKVELTDCELTPANNGVVDCANAMESTAANRWLLTGTNTLGQFAYADAKDVAITSRTVWMNVGEPADGVPTSAKVTFSVDDVEFAGATPGYTFKIADYDPAVVYDLTVNDEMQAVSDFSDTIDIWDAISGLSGDVTVKITASKPSVAPIAMIGADAYTTVEDLIDAIENYTGEAATVKLMADVDFNNAELKVVPALQFNTVSEVKLSNVILDGKNVTRTSSLFLMDSDEDFTLENVTVKNVVASVAGAVMTGTKNKAGNVVFEKCSFTDNAADGNGCVYNCSSNSSTVGREITFNNCKFTRNTSAAEGGVLRIGTSDGDLTYVTFKNCTFVDNAVIGDTAGRFNIAKFRKGAIENCTVSMTTPNNVPNFSHANYPANSSFHWTISGENQLGGFAYGYWGGKTATSQKRTRRVVYMQTGTPEAGVPASAEMTFSTKNVVFTGAAEDAGYTFRVADYNADYYYLFEIDGVAQEVDSFSDVIDLWTKMAAAANTADGVTVKITASVEPFATYAAKIDDTKYETLEEAIAAVGDGETIVLLADCAGNGVVVPSGKNFTIDFAGHTYTVDGETVGSTGTKTSGFQLLKDSTIKFMNGTLTSTKAKILIQNYADLTLDNMVLDGSSLVGSINYTLSTNNGSTVIKDTTITAKDGAFAFDVCSFKPYTGNAVAVEGDSKIVGKIEVSTYNETIPELALNGGDFTEAEIVVSADGGDKVVVTKDEAAVVVIPDNYKWEENTLKPDSRVAKIGATKYDTLEEAFAAVGDGETIVLLADCAGNGVVVPSGKNFTVDFAGHTYTVDGETVGSTGTKTLAFQLLKDSTITFKNGTLTSGKAKMLVQNYANLTLDNMVLDGSSLVGSINYTLSTNNGSTVIKDTTITAKDGAFAFDVCSFKPYTGNAVAVEGGSKIVGKIEVSTYNETIPELALNGGDFTEAEIVVSADGGDKVVVTKAEAAEVAIPEGYKWDENTLVAIEYVAEIGTTKYETVADAYKVVGADEVITLLQDAVLEEAITLDNKVNLNGKTLTVDADMAVNSDAAIYGGTLKVNTAKTVSLGKNGGYVPVMTDNDGDYKTYDLYELYADKITGEHVLKMKTLETYETGAKFKMGYKFADNAAYAALKNAYEMSGSNIRMGLSITDGKMSPFENLHGYLNLSADAMSKLLSVDVEDPDAYFGMNMTVKSATLEAFTAQIMIKSTQDLGFFFGGASDTWTK